MNLLKRNELNRQLQLKTTQSNLLKIEQLRTLFDALNTQPEALKAFSVLMNERHKKAEINSRQALVIIHKDSLLSKFQNISENSEILKFGKSLWNALHKKGDERKEQLRSYGLVHKSDHNQVVMNLRETIEEQMEGITRQKTISSTTIRELEKTNDKLRKHNKGFKDFIVANYGVPRWNEIEAYVLKNTQKDV